MASRMRRLSGHGTSRLARLRPSPLVQIPCRVSYTQTGVRAIPRATDGAYSLPSGSLVSAGETIEPSQHNPPLQDLASAITGSLSRDGQGGMRTNLSIGGFRVTNMAPGVQSTDAATVGQLAGISGVPVGAMMDWPAATAPTGWLICAGQALSRTDYSDLFAVVGTSFGAPSGSTFNLPDMRGRVSAGLDVDSGGYADRLTTPNSRTLGATGGAQTVTLTEAQMPTHTHEVSGNTNAAGGHFHDVDAFDGSTFLAGNGATLVLRAGGAPYQTQGVSNHTHTITVDADDAGGGEAHSNVQPVMVINKIIKVSSS